MNKSRFSGLGGVMRSQADLPASLVRDGGDEPAFPGEDDHEDECEAGDGDKKKEPKMSKETPAAAANTQAENVQPVASDQIAVAVAAERARIGTVFASEHVAGREQVAAHMLAESDMSAEAIVAMLPKISPAAAAEDTEQAAREEMRNALAETNNSSADATGGKPADKSEDAGAVWAAAHAAVFPNTKAI